MVRRKSVVDAQGVSVEGTVVPILESIERFGQVKLEDGSVIQAKLTVVEAIRIEDQWDNEGNPAYVVKSHNVIQVIESPPHLRKGGGAAQVSKGVN